MHQMYLYGTNLGLREEDRKTLDGLRLEPVSYETGALDFPRNQGS